MSLLDDYQSHDATALAERLRRREVSAGDLLESAIRRIEQQNPALNAVVHQLYDDAAQRVAEGLPDGPFTGVPFLVKDLYTFCAGAPCTNGSRLFEGYVTEDDSEMVRRYRAAGLVILGKTSTSEFGLSVSTEPSATGATRNPWSLRHSAMGSSGGSAAAVAAGMVLLAHASDGGGSIRIPASACGLFGLKPTRARNPSGEGWAGLAVNHAVTRSVRDSAALLDATHGYAPGYPYCAPSPARPFVQEVGANPGRLRIALSFRTPADIALHPECRKAAEDAAKLAAELGHLVEEATPEVDYDKLRWAMDTIIYANTAETLAQPHPVEGRPITADDVERTTWIAGDRGRQLSAVDYIDATWAVQGIGQQLGRFLERYDVILSPTLAEPPALLGAIDPEDEDFDRFITRILPYVAFTQMFNMSGQPAASLPLHWTADGLPVGVQIAGRFGDEATLLRLSGQFEEARPWSDRHSPEPFPGGVDP